MIIEDCKHCEHYVTDACGDKVCAFDGDCENYVQTNEEWLRSATFEELAGAIYEWHTKGYARGKNGLPLNPITEVVEWLKQPKE